MVYNLDLVDTIAPNFKVSSVLLIHQTNPAGFLIPRGVVWCSFRRH